MRLMKFLAFGFITLSNNFYFGLSIFLRSYQTLILLDLPRRLSPLLPSLSLGKRGHLDKQRIIPRRRKIRLKRHPLIVAMRIPSGIGVRIVIHLAKYVSPTSKYCLILWRSTYFLRVSGTVLDKLTFPDWPVPHKMVTGPVANLRMVGIPRNHGLIRGHYQAFCIYFTEDDANVMFTNCWYVCWPLFRNDA